MFGMTGQEADIKSLEQTVVMKLQEISKLQAELKGTVTTKYHDEVVLGATNRHDQVVAEACRLVGKLQAENDKLQAQLELAESIMRNHDCHDVWSDAIKEVK